MWPHCMPFPLFFAYVAGLSEVIDSWLVILGLLTPLGALALSSTLVMLYLGGSLALLLVGQGRLSFDSGMAPEAH